MQSAGKTPLRSDELRGAQRKNSNTPSLPSVVRRTKLGVEEAQIFKVYYNVSISYTDTIPRRSLGMNASRPRGLPSSLKLRRTGRLLLLANFGWAIRNFKYRLQFLVQQYNDNHLLPRLRSAQPVAEHQSYRLLKLFG